jgi:hypothetical protein
MYGSNLNYTKLNQPNTMIKSSMVTCNFCPMMSDPVLFLHSVKGPSLEWGERDSIRTGNRVEGDVYQTALAP